MSERDLIGALSRLFATPGSSRVASLGIGDDAAVLRSVRTGVVWTVDVSVEGVHFERRFLSLADIGARSFHAAVSDLAAMGARPVAALSSLVVPARLGARAVREIARGQAEAALRLSCPVVGGNLSAGGELSVTTTAVGVAKRPLTREGARAGDEVWLVGDVGLAAAGFRFLSARGRRPALGVRTRKAIDVAVNAWRRPEALVRAGMRLALRARAAIDVSDGLGGDAGHLAAASRVRVVLEEPALLRALRPELLEAASFLRADPLELALLGGEDYALLATGPAHRRPREARRIGRVENGRGAVVERVDGRTYRAGVGFDHFRRGKSR